jgi:hypothetical protein
LARADICNREPAMIFANLRSLQQRCDQLSFSIHGKHVGELSEAEILAHKCFHLGKALGKVSTVCEAADHGSACSTEKIVQEVVPDLIIYAMQLANLYDVDLDSLFVERIEHVLHKHPDDGVGNIKKNALIADLMKLLRTHSADLISQ